MAKLIYRLIIFTLIFIFVNTFFAPTTSQGETLPPSISVASKLVSGLRNPLGVYNAGDGPGRLFIVEQYGLIKIVKNNQVLSVPFLDVHNLLPCGPGANEPNCGERGLLGLAFHPNFAVNGHFYINYTRKPDGATVIARYGVSSNPDIANANSRTEILVIGQPYPNHNGGHIAFGKDGYLYIGMGDGGSGGDPLNNSQNINNLLGKMLRIDVDNPNPGSFYKIPPGNLKDEIWALGLRNPWFWSFDRITGDLYIGDVGQNAWEEIDFRRFVDPPGANFGWSCLEASYAYNLNRYPCSDANYVSKTILPIAEYSHAQGQSVTGGYVYRGVLYPSLYGRYFYADFAYGKIWSLKLESLLPLSFSEPVLHLDENFLISCFGEDEQGELFVCDFNGGSIRRLQDSSGAPPNLSGSWFRSDPIYANNSENVLFTLRLVNSGGESNQPLNTEITIPPGLNYILGSASATSGIVNAVSPSILVWSGVLSANQPIDITFEVTVISTRNNEISQALISGGDYTSMLLKNALLIPKPIVGTTPQDFILPGTQPNSLVDPIMLPSTCDVCHTAEIYDRWQGSMMSQSGRDPLFWAALEVANHDAPGSGEFCIRCHMPKGWFEGRSSNPDGSLLEQSDLDAGIACEICHRAVDSVPTTNSADQAAARDNNIRSTIANMSTEHIGSAMMIVDPQDFRRGPFDLNINFAFHPNQTYQTDYLGGDPSNVLARSRLCGTCHNVDNPFLSWSVDQQEYLPNELNTPPGLISEQDQLFAVETTYEEWLNSAYVATTACQDCHMPKTIGYGAESFFNPPLRDCEEKGCLPVHEFVGGNTWVPMILQDERWRLNRSDLADQLNSTIQKAQSMLSKAAKVEVGEIISSETNTQVSIRITNLTGHKLPTGYSEGRRMWLDVTGYDDIGQTVFSTCSYNYGSGVLNETPPCIVFEVKQAISQKLVDILGLNLIPGESFHFVLNNSVQKDNRIPPAGFSAEALTRRSMQPVINGTAAPDLYQPGQNYYENTFLLPSTVVRVTAVLYYQSTSKEYIEFLRDNGGTDAQTLYDLWQDNKNSPEIIAWGSYPIYLNYFPIIER